MSSIETDTIVAPATSPGRSGIGIVRLSGPQSLGILRQLIRSQTFDPQPNMLTLHSLFDTNGDDVLDQGMVCFFKAPHSFTGEDVVEHPPTVERRSVETDRSARIISRVRGR